MLGAIGGIIQGVSGVAGNILDYLGQSNANSTNVQLARENREWQQYMSNTAHVREVQDLRNAGLNPILSAGGSGASTPSGTTATVSNPAANAGAKLNQTATNALSAMQAAKQLQATDAGIRNTNAQTANVEADTAIKTGTMPDRIAQAGIKTVTDTIKQRTAELDQDLKVATTEANRSRTALNGVLGILYAAEARVSETNADALEVKRALYHQLNKFMPLLDKAGTALANKVLNTLFPDKPKSKPVPGFNHTPSPAPTQLWGGD